MKENSEKAKKPIFKKWWFWLIIVALVVGIFGNTGNQKTEPVTVTAAESVSEQPAEAIKNDADDTNEGETYNIVGGELGEYGKEVILNPDSDMPVAKYLYKLPAGDYVVVNNGEYPTNFYVVKDEIIKEEGNTEYPESLNYVGEGLLLMGSNGNDLNGNAKEQIEISLAEDESFLILEESNLTFTKK